MKDGTMTVEEIRKQNEELLAGFQQEMEDAGLKQPTRFAHARNADLYINYYLQAYMPTEAHRGWSSLGGFFGSWMPAKVGCFSDSTIKQCIAGIRKFYRYLADKGLVTEEELRMMEKGIREDKKGWLHSG